MEQRLRGKLITFEGGDGAGKTTQIKKLAIYLLEKGYETVQTLEPGDNSLGSELRKLILTPGRSISAKAELFLYLADRAQHISQIIKPALLDNKIVISDRFADATLAYQGYGRGLDIALVKQMNVFATDNIEPDLTFLLDLEASFGKKRTEKRGETADRMESEKIEFHQKLREGYLSIAKENPYRFKVIDATLSIEDIASIIQKEVELILV